MIEMYNGTPGSGKSLHTARKITNALRFHADPIICNFKVNMSRYKRLRGNFLYIDNEFLTPDKLINFSRNYAAYKGRRLREGEILLIIDEAQLLFSCREWGQNNRKAWIAFFTQHRKLGYDVIIVCQFDKMIDKHILANAEYSYIHRKVDNYGVAGKILSLLCGGHLFVCIKVWYPMKVKVGSEFFLCHKRHYEIYDTQEIFNTVT